MNPYPFLLLTAWSVGCGSSPVPQGHEHTPGGGHEEVAPATPAPAPVGTPASAVLDGPDAFPLGSHTARLEPTTAGLRLTVVDAAGVSVSPSGEARVALTGTGEAEQRVVLAPDGVAWSGAAKSTGAKGYVAVISVEIAGHTEVARVSWGEVPPPVEPPHTHGPDGHDDHGHDH